MDRRQFLATSLVGLTVGGGGCLFDSSDGSPPEVDADELELEPGAERTLTITGDRVVSLGIVERPDPDTVEIDTGNPDVSPEPDGIDESVPPTFHWSSPESVEYTTSVRVGDDAESGDYGYTVVASGANSDESESLSEEFTISVV